MPSFENFVRPFQRTDISPFRTQLPTGTTGATGPGETITLTWGLRGTIKAFSGSRSINGSYYVVHKPTEQEGTTDVTGATGA